MKHTRHVALAGAALTVLAGLTGSALAAQREDPQVAVGRAPKVAFNQSFVSPLVEVFGDVRVGRKVFVAGNTVVRADPGHRVCIGSETNLQDNILFLALSAGRVPRAPCGRRSSSTEERVSIAHQAEIVNSRIGSFTFVGFHARLSNVVLEDGAFVLHGAVLRDVRIRRDRIVPVGAVITTQAQADALARKADAQSEFQPEVLEVNEEFAERYADLYRSRGYRGVVGASPAPRTTFNNGRARPVMRSQPP